MRKDPMRKCTSDLDGGGGGGADDRQTTTNNTKLTNKTREERNRTAGQVGRHFLYLCVINT